MIKDEEKNLEEVMNYRSFKLSHARPSLLRRVMGLPLGGLDRVTSRVLDKSKLRICTADGCLTEVEGTTKPTLTTSDLDDPCLAFLWPQ